MTESRACLTYHFASVDLYSFEDTDSTEHMAFTTQHIFTHNSFMC